MTSDDRAEFDAARAAGLRKRHALRLARPAADVPLREGELTMPETLTWPEQVLREAPQSLFEVTGNATRDRRTRESLEAFLKARNAYPSLLELDAERNRRKGQMTNPPFDAA